MTGAAKLDDVFDKYWAAVSTGDASGAVSEEVVAAWRPASPRRGPAGR